MYCISETPLWHLDPVGLLIAYTWSNQLAWLNYVNRGLWRHHWKRSSCSPQINIILQILAIQSRNKTNPCVHSKDLREMLLEVLGPLSLVRTLFLLLYSIFVLIKSLALICSMVSSKSFQLSNVLHSLQMYVCFQVLFKIQRTRFTKFFLEGIDLRKPYLHKIKIKVKCVFAFW